MKSINNKINELGLKFYESRHERDFTELYNLSFDFYLNVSFKKRYHLHDELEGVLAGAFEIMYRRIEIYSCWRSFFSRL